MPRCCSKKRRSSISFLFILAKTVLLCTQSWILGGNELNWISEAFRRTPSAISCYIAPTIWDFVPEGLDEPPSGRWHYEVPLMGRARAFAVTHDSEHNRSSRKVCLREVTCSRGTTRSCLVASRVEGRADR